jgi:hypothetical protein
MRPEDLRGLLRREPFQPLRLTLTNSTTYDILHPELALIGRSYVQVGLARPGDPDNIADRMVTISLLHIMQIEPLESVSPPSGR